MDGLLLTRRQRLRGFGEKTALVLGPTLVLALVTLALGEWVDAAFVVAVAGITAVSVGSVIRSRRGAAVLGMCLLAALVVLMIFSAWIVSHPAPS